LNKTIYCFRGNKLEILVGFCFTLPTSGEENKEHFCTQEKRKTLLCDQEQFTTGARTTLLVSQDGLLQTQENSEPRTNYTFVTGQRTPI
jgi:hypothetical protein